MYVQGEYNKDWERVGDEESVPVIFQIFQIFRFIAIFEPPQNAWDKNFQNECKRTTFKNQDFPLVLRAGLVHDPSIPQRQLLNM
jgi:hypothetical protein